MNLLKLQPPFVWPEPRSMGGMETYEHNPPFGALALESRALFGIVSAFTMRGVNVLETWLDRNSNLKACLIVMVYPGCATRQSDLSRLLQVVKCTSDRLSVHVQPLERNT